MDSQVNKALHDMSLNIIPSEDYLLKGVHIIKKIMNILQRNGLYNIGHYTHPENNGSKTTISEDDFVCVVFLNEDEPPYDYLLTQWKRIIDKYSKAYDIVTLQIKILQNSLNIVADEFKLDLFPAPNFVSCGIVRCDHCIPKQHKKILERIKEYPLPFRTLYTSGLVEVKELFFRTQKVFLQDMIRIAKLWYKKVFENESFIYEGKTLVEVIMIHAAEQEKYNSHLNCFKIFLNMMHNFESLDVIIWKMHLRDNTHGIPWYVRDQRPLVLEPGNPYNNLANYWDETNRTRLKDAAIKTIQKINKILNSRFCNSVEVLFRKF